MGRGGAEKKKIDVKTYLQGRCINDEVLLLANVYGPNNDESQFTLNLQADHVIMGTFSGT